MEARLTKREVEKIVQKHIPSILIKRWENTELIVEVDMQTLKRSTVRGIDILSFTRSSIRKSDYVLCPIMKADKEKMFIVLQ